MESDRRTWLTLRACGFVNGIAVGMVSGSLPLALLSEGDKAVAIAMVMSAGVTTGVFASVPAGWIADAISKRRAMQIAVTFVVISLIAQSAVKGAIESAIVLVCQWVANVSFSVAQLAFAGTLAAGKSQVASTATTTIVGVLGVAVGPAFAILLWQHGIGRPQYLCGAVLATVAFLMLCALPGDRPRKHRRPRTILVRSSWLPPLFFGIASTVYAGVIGALSVVTYHVRGIADPALLLTGPPVALFIFRHPMSRLVERYGPRLIAVPAALALAVGCVIAGFARSSLEIAIASLFLGAAAAGMFHCLIALLFERSSHATRGRALGVLSLAFTIGPSCGGLVATVCSALGLGYSFAMLFAAITSIGFLPVLFMSRPHRTSGRSRCAAAV